MATAADSRTVSLAMPAKPEYVVLARLALSAVCRLTPFEADEVADLKLAITEAAALLVGPSPSGDAGQLRFEFELQDERLTLDIHGPPAGQVQDGVSPEERDLGREIIRATADESEHGEDHVRLVKFLRPAAE